MVDKEAQGARQRDSRITQRCKACYAGNKSEKCKTKGSQKTVHEKCKTKARQRHKTRHRIQECVSNKCESKVQDVGFDKLARQEFMTLDSTKV